MSSWKSPFANVIGFDDAPFGPDDHGPVKVVGTIFARTQLNGIIMGQVEKDGYDAAETLAHLVAESKFFENLQLIMLQGITLAGFNLVDVFALYKALNLPVLVVARKSPDMEAIRQALLAHIPSGRQKWSVLEKLGPMISVSEVYVQHLGLSLAEARHVVEDFAVYSHIPEPLRVAHLIAGAVATGESRGKV